MQTRVLWIVDQEAGRAACFADEPDVSVSFAGNLFEALRHLETSEFEVVIATVPLPDTSPELLIDEILQLGTHSSLILHAPEANFGDAVRWTKLGAYQVLQNEANLADAIAAAVSSRQIHSLASHLASSSAPPWRRLLIGKSLKMHHVAETIRLIAPRRCTVLISGETGTGKEVVARCIHEASNRSQFELVAVNCSALPENLLEAELFGHVKGAFTGAIGQRVGRFEQAQRGTLFLDEIGDMPLPLQSKLLRVLQEREFQRLGSSETVRVDVRVIAATNVNLVEKVREGLFREDLYYRLNVGPIVVPPLRERTIDLELLVRYFIDKICRSEGIAAKHASDAVIERLRECDWPGNVRQLENAVEMAIALSGDRSILYPADFPLPKRARFADVSYQAFVAVPDQGLDFEKIVGGIELNILEQALRKTGGNKKLAAEMLGLKRTTLAAKLKSLSHCVETAQCAL